MTARLVRHPDVLVQELDGELLLLRPGTSDVLHLDAVASCVWELLEQPMDEADLITELAQAYREPVARVASDLRPALDVLRAHGLLREV